MAMDTAGILEGATLNHVAIVVRSIVDARERHAALGVTTSWTDTWEIEVPAHHRGNEIMMAARAAYGVTGAPVMLEIVEPVNDASPFATFLRERGEGVQHFGYRFDDLEARLDRAKAAGIEIDWLISDEHGPAVAFLSPDASHGVSLELVRNSPPIDAQAWTKQHG
jgi:4-hydroxyphenylpyruvate dioxygenase-like putative hemolysin